VVEPDDAEKCNRSPLNWVHFFLEVDIREIICRSLCNTRCCIDERGCRWMLMDKTLLILLSLNKLACLSVSSSSSSLPPFHGINLSRPSRSLSVATAHWGPRYSPWVLWSNTLSFSHCSRDCTYHVQAIRWLSGYNTAELVQLDTCSRSVVSYYTPSAPCEPGGLFDEMHRTLVGKTSSSI
jgi:hypothetical protein